MNTWIVRLEAAVAGGFKTIEVRDVAALIDALGAYSVALYAPDRCGLQLRQEATTPAEALYAVSSRWQAAIARLDLPPLEVVRSEVLTLEEFESEPETGDSSEHKVVLSQEAPTTDAEELIRRALSDPLTTLNSRDVFLHRLDAALAARQDLRQRIAVLCLDLNDFRSVNARFGASTGDEVLIVVGQRLGATLRRTDVLARLGGDRFSILVEDAGDDDLRVLVERLLEAIAHPIQVQDEEVVITASMGIARVRPNDGDGEAILARAVTAMFLAKDAGGNSWEAYDSESSIGSRRAAHTATAVHDHFAYIVLLQQAAIAANESGCLDEAAHAVLRQVCKYTGSAVGHLYVTAADGRAVLAPWAARHGSLPEGYDGLRRAIEGTEFLPGVGLPGRVLESREPVWVADVRTDPDLELAGPAAAAGVVTAFAVPVLVDADVVAVLERFSSGPFEPNAALLEVLGNIGTQLGRVVERARAREALEESQARLQEAQAIGRLGSWRSDVSTGETTWSDELYAILGLDPSTAPDLDRFLALVHPDEQGAVAGDFGTIRQMLEGDPLLEFRILRRTGVCAELPAVAQCSGTRRATSWDCTRPCRTSPTTSRRPSAPSPVRCAGISCSRDRWRS